MAYPPPAPGGYPPQPNNPAYPPGAGYPPQPGPPGYGAPQGPPHGHPGYGPPGGAPPPAYGPPPPGYGAPAQPFQQPGYAQAPAPSQGPQPGRPFYIRSEMHGKVLDIEGGNPSPGARVIIWPRKPHQEQNQLWYMDQQGCIRSKLNDMMLDATYGPLQMQHCNGNPKQMWSIQGNKICNRTNPNEVVDIAQNNHEDGAEVCCWSYNGGSNQHWVMDWL